MFLTLGEIIQLIVLTVVLGYIFSSFIQRPKPLYELRPWFDWDDVKFAAMVAAPAVILHEFGHKFVALALGLEATFSIWPTGLFIGIVLKLLHSPILFLAPAYVSFSANATAMQSILISVAGPAVNLLLWGISAHVLKTKRRMTQNELVGWAISKKLNLFLFVFNMIPVPPLDGFKVLLGIIHLF
ncbi:MAG TPA: M50 family metallopeptidase [Candidatus Nanoarchaeia archaeon]|nr:M50 family metallopeptidase [Candidatus Nanoarchaeia archaeon]